MALSAADRKILADIQELRQRRFDEEIQAAEREILAEEQQPEPETPEIPVETTKTTETEQEAGADGTGAKRSRTEEVSRPAGGEPPAEPAAPQEGQEPEPTPKEGEGKGEKGEGLAEPVKDAAAAAKEWLTEEGRDRPISDWLKVPVQGALQGAQSLEEFAMGLAKDGLGLASWVDRSKGAVEGPRTPSAVALAREQVAFSDPDDPLLNAAATLSMLIVGYGGIATGLAKAGMVAKGSMAARAGVSAARSVVAGGLAEGVLLDPTGDRISTWLSQYPSYQATFIHYLGSNDEYAPIYEGHLKNAMEGAIAGAAIEVIPYLRHVRRVYQAIRSRPKTPVDEVMASLEKEAAAEDIADAVATTKEVTADTLSKKITDEAVEEAGELEKKTLTEREMLGLSDEHPDWWIDESKVHMTEADRARFEQRVEERLAGPKDDGPMVLEHPTGKPYEPMEGDMGRMDDEGFEVPGSELDAAKGRAFAAVQAAIKKAGLDPATMPKEQNRAAMQAFMKGESFEVPAEIAATKGGDEAATARAIEEAEALDALDEEMFSAHLEASAAAKEKKYVESFEEGVPQIRERMEESPQMYAESHAGEQASLQTQERKTAFVELVRRAGTIAREPVEHLESAALERVKGVQRALRDVATWRTHADLRSDVQSAKDRRFLGYRMRLQAEGFRKRHVRLEQAMRHYEEGVASRADQVRQAGEGTEPDPVVHRNAMRALWRNQPTDGSAVGISPETHAQALQGVTREVVDADQLAADVVAQERDAMTIAPLNNENRYLGGVEDRVETPERAGINVSPHFGDRVEDFASVPAEIQRVRPGDSTGRAVQAQASIELLMRDAGLPEDMRLRAEVVENGTAAEHLEMLTALANDVRRAAGRGVTGKGDLGDLWDAEAAQGRLAAYVRWLGGQDGRAKEILGYLPRDEWRGLHGADKVKAQTRAAEVAGVSHLLSRAAVGRQADTLEKEVMAALQVQAAKPQLSKARRAIQGTLHMTVGGWLSGPSTQILNAVSTASMTTLKIAKQPLSRVMSRIWYSGEGTPQDGLMKFASSQATAQLSGAWEGLLQTRQILRQSRIRQGFVTEAGRAKAQVEMNEAMAGERGRRHQLNAQLVKPMLDQMDVHEKMDMDPYRPEEQRLMGGQMLSAGKAGVPVGWVHAAENVKALNGVLGAGVRTASNGYTGATDAPLATLKMNDVFWRTIMLRSSLRARATERAMADNAPGTLGREELIEGRIRDIEERSWDPGDRDHDLWSAAAKDAEEAAFVGEMPQWAEKLLASANASAGGSPRHLFPFVRSLTNVGVAGARHSIPGGEPAWRAMKGRMSQTERDRWDLLDAAAKAGERGEVAAGQVLSVVGGSLAWGLVANGIATGGNAQRDQLRRAKKDLDPEYSLKIGDTHYTRYAEMFGPVGMQTAMFADLYELQQVLRNENDVDRFDTAMQAAINFSTVLAEQTPLGTGTEWAEEFSRIVFKEEPGEKMDAAGRLLQKEMKSRLVNVIPLSALRRKISEAASGGVRRTSRPDVEGVEDDGEILDYGWWKQTWSAVLREATRGNPFADSSLPPVRGLNRTPTR